MKKKEKILGIIVLAMIIGLLMASCGGTECTDHQVEWTVTKPATINEEGEEEGTCPNCEAIETRPIPRYAVFFGTWKNVGTTTGVDLGQNRSIKITEDKIELRNSHPSDTTVASSNILDFIIDDWKPAADRPTPTFLQNFTKGYRADGHITGTVKGWGIETNSNVSNAVKNGTESFSMFFYYDTSATSSGTRKIVLTYLVGASYGNVISPSTANPAVPENGDRIYTFELAN